MRQHPLGSSELEQAALTTWTQDKSFRRVALEAARSGVDQARRMNSQLGVACFSENRDDMLLWAHYADGHRGFCLEFDTSAQPFRKAKKVVYSTEYPSFNYFDLAIRKKFDAASMLATKSKHWEYEQEWRIVNQFGNVEVQTDAMVLISIYFGCAMPVVHKEIIEMLLRGSPTKLYEMQRSETDFSVYPSVTEYSRFDYLWRATKSPRGGT